MFRKEKQFYTFLRNFLAGQEVSSQIWLARYTLVPSSPFWETDYGCAVNLPSKKYNGCPTKRQTALTTISSVLYQCSLISDCPFCQVSALRLWTRALMSCLDARLGEREKSSQPSLSLTITKPQIQSSQINDVTIIERLALSSMNFCLFSLEKNKRHDEKVFSSTS